MKPVYLSVIIPVYNETKRLHHLNEVAAFLKTKKFTTEIIVVNDGSTDATLRQLKRFPKALKLKIISYPKNRGKGFAIKTGMLKARGQYRLFMDVDLSTPLDQLDKFLPFFGKADVIIGTRKNNQARVLVRQSFIRNSLGKGFTWLSQQILQVPVSDFTCGFKCFSAVAAKTIFNQMQIDRWGFDAEILYLARKYGFKIKEVPVTWINDAQTKVRFPQDIINSLTELLTVVYNDRVKHLYR